jgi:hypothetical protein
MRIVGVKPRLHSLTLSLPARQSLNECNGLFSPAIN